MASLPAREVFANTEARGKSCLNIAYPSQMEMDGGMV